jgi:hypothetical protein
MKKAGSVRVPAFSFSKLILPRRAPCERINCLIKRFFTIHLFSKGLRPGFAV